MTGWLFFAVMALVCAGLAAAYVRTRSAAGEERRRLEQARTTAVERVEADSEARVERLRREADRERSSTRDELVRDLLPAIDSLEIACDGVEDEDVRTGIGMALGEFRRALARHDVTEVAPDVGSAFDPNLHEAVETVEHGELDHGTVARCHRPGWRTPDRVLRPAMVAVVRNEPAADPESPDGERPLPDTAEEPHEADVALSPEHATPPAND